MCSSNRLLAERSGIPGALDHPLPKKWICTRDQNASAGACHNRCGNRGHKQKLRVSLSPQIRRVSSASRCRKILPGLAWAVHLCDFMTKVGLAGNVAGKDLAELHWRTH